MKIATDHAPLVSIITPAYNAEKFILETIESVKSQTYINWEHIIVVDNNSKDSTLQLVMNESSKDNRIKCVTSTKAIGAHNNRNIGIEYSKGKYIAFIDADDLWTRDKLEKQIQFMSNNKYDFTFSGFTRISEDGKNLGSYLSVPERLNYSMLLKDNPIGCLTVVLEKDILQENPFQEKGWEDMSLWLDLLRSGRFAYGINESLALYRIVKNSRSNNKIFSAKLRWQTLRNFEKLSLVTSIYYFIRYAFSGVLKHFRF